MRAVILVYFCGLIQSVTAQSVGICGKTLLWEITRPGTPHTSYVFGTIHLIDKDKFFWPDSLLWALDQTAMAVFEVDMLELANPLLQVAFLPEMLLEDGQTLDDFIDDPADRRVLNNYIARSGLPLSLVKRIKPMFLGALIEGDAPIALKKTQTTSYEKEILSQARQRKMMIDGLEDVNDQLAILNQTPYQSQLDDLIATIRYQDSTKTDILALLTDLYVQQDLCAMWQMINPEEHPVVINDKTYLLDQRNINWIPLMQRKMRRRPVFFAVGAAHLPGPLGVLNLLAQSGYQVRPVGSQN